MKKFFAVATATVMTLAMSVSAFAGLVTEDKTYDGSVKADGSAGWNSAGTGETFSIDDKGVTIVFENDALTRTTGTKDNWDNFIIETIASASADGVTMRADAFSWTYILNNSANGEVATNTATVAVDKSWGDDWTNFQTLTDKTDVTVVAKKTDANTVTFDITFASDADAWEKYTVTYPDGVPADLSFQIGADGGIVVLKSVDYANNDTADTPAGDTPAGDTPADTTPKTGDMTAVLPVALLAVAAMAVVVVMRKRTVTE